MITEHIAANGPRTFSELALDLGLPRSSLHALLKTLATSGWLQFRGDQRRYAVGIRAWEVGNAYTRGFELYESAAASMTRLRDKLRETVQLAVLDGRFNVYVGKVDGPNLLTLASRLGSRLEAHATGIGKALLSDLEPEELDRRFAGVTLERLTPTTIAKLDELHRELQLVRERGYAVDNEEYTAGVHCVAVVIRDHTRRAVAALSVSTPTVRASDTGQGLALDALHSEAALVSRELGYAPV
jgi:DNA-binding IclR family transcriptional regulator